MKNSILLFLLFMVPFIGVAQELNQTVYDDEAGKQILIGSCDRSGLMAGEFGVYFDEYYQSYDPDKSALKGIRSEKEGVTVTIVLGTWCHDSKEQVPRFYKILDKLKWKEENIRQFCVNTSKKAEDIDMEGLDIVKVPTFIFYRNGKEIGRIIETPVKSLEEDMMMILE